MHLPPFMPYFTSKFPLQELDAKVIIIKKSTRPDIKMKTDKVRRCMFSLKKWNWFEMGAIRVEHAVDYKSVYRGSLGRSWMRPLQ